MDFSDLLKPANIISILLGIAGLIVGGLTYLWSQHEPAISFKTTTIPIVERTADAPFSIIDENGRPVSGNVFALTATIWNSGDASIDEQAVRTPLTIKLNENVSILDIRIEYASSNNVSEFKFDSLSKNSVKIKWRYFDPSEGFRIKFIYSAKQASDLKIEGKIYGVKSVSDNSRSHSSGYSWVFWLASGFFFGALAGAWKYNDTRYLRWGLLVMFSMTLVTAVIDSFFMKAVDAPF